MDICTEFYWILYSVESMQIDCEPEYNDTLVRVHLFRRLFHLLKSSVTFVVSVGAFSAPFTLSSYNRKRFTC